MSACTAFDLVASAAGPHLVPAYRLAAEHLSISGPERSTIAIPASRAGRRCGGRTGLAGDGNLGSHKSATIRRAVKAAGARHWFLPPCSPDLNPIEQAFSKIRHWMRHAPKRTIDDIWRHIGTPVKAIQPDECTNGLLTAGCASAKT